MAEAADYPPMEKSDESDEGQLALAKAQGDAYENALREMLLNEADTGDERLAGDYIVSLAVEKAEGMWMMHGGKLKWMKPRSENCHIEIVVRDAADGRFVPGLKVRVTVTEEDGKRVGAKAQPFVWHPWLHHYGANWKVPREGSYSVKVEVGAAPFMRHDEKNGKRYAKPVALEFKGVKISPGKK